MTKRIIKNLIRGAGSVLDVWPANQHRHYYHRLHKSTSHALQKTWKRVGNNLAHSLNNPPNVVKEKEEKRVEPRSSIS